MQHSHQVFISYRRINGEDNPRALRIYSLIEDEFGAGSAFLDDKRTPVGTSFPSFLSEAIAQSKGLVLVLDETMLSSGSVCSLESKDDWVRKELETALVENVPILPVLVSSDGWGGVKGMEKYPDAFFPEELSDLKDRHYIYLDTSIRCFLQDLIKYKVNRSPSLEAHKILDEFNRMFGYYVLPSVLSLIVSILIGRIGFGLSPISRDLIDWATGFYLSGMLLIVSVVSYYVELRVAMRFANWEIARVGLGIFFNALFFAVLALLSFLLSREFEYWVYSSSVMADSIAHGFCLWHYSKRSRGIT